MSIINKLLCLLASQCGEYLAVDQDFNILEASFGVQRFADRSDEIIKGKDVRLGFPELVGLEDILTAILQGQQRSYELKSIGRVLDQGDLLYFDIYFISTPPQINLTGGLMIFFEDVTARMLLEQTLVQSSNEKGLLLSALSTAKNYVDTIITSIADALLVTKSSGRIKTINQAAQALFGYSEAELIDKPISIIITDPNFIEVANQQHFLFNQTLKNVEVICQTKTGEKIVVAFSCSTIQAEETGLQDLIYIGRDITEHQRNRQRQAVQYAITSLLSESTTINQVTQRILQEIGENLGWDFGEIWTSDQDFASLGQEDEATRVLRCVEIWVRPLLMIPELKNFQGKTVLASWEGLVSRVWRTGSPYWISDVAADASLPQLHGAFAVPILGDGELLGVITFYSYQVQRFDEDLLQMMVTIGSQVGQFVKRKQAEAALLESEERYRDLFENASDLIQSCDHKGGFIYVNRAWRETLGYSSAEVAQMQLFDIIDPDCQADCLASVYRVMAGEKIDQFKVVFIRKDGKKISLEGNINGKFVNGKLVASRAIFRDITKRLETEEALRQQQEQTERLLLNILPEPIAQCLKQETSTIAESFAEVSVLFADIVGFTQIAAFLSPIELVDLLNEIFSAFDRLSEKHGLEKIKTIGDAYMVVGGLPTRRTDHAEAIAEMALDMQTTIAQFREKMGQEVNIRIGINTGPVVAGVIGIKKFSYDLWGDTVNIASRMESHGLAGQIQVTAVTYERLQEKYSFEERGVIPVKGKGEMTTYLLTGRKLE
jgi:PAS domain S-box-containing protein